MKQLNLILALFVFLFWGCSPSQKITASWISPDAKAKPAYTSIFLMAHSDNDDVRFSMEKKLARLLKENNRNSVNSTDLFPAASVQKGVTSEQLMSLIKEKGCDAVFTIALLDTKETERYVTGTGSYSPYGVNYGYYNYYNYYHAQVYTPGYYVTDKTYYIESNLYDVASDKMMWSIQSSACDPKNFDTWFSDYSRLILGELNKRGLIKKG